MLGLEPDGEHLTIRPAVPVTIGDIELLDIPGRWGRTNASSHTVGQAIAGT
jgi:hypothetical protein